MDDKIIRAIKLHAPLSRVWEAPTNSKQFGEWFQNICFPLRGPLCD